MCSQKIITPSQKSFKSHAVFCLKDFHNVMKSFLNENFILITQIIQETFKMYSSMKISVKKNLVKPQVYEKKKNDPSEAISFLPHHCDVFCLKVLTFGGK